MKQICFYLLLLFCFCSNKAIAQTGFFLDSINNNIATNSNYVIVDNIIVKGNKRTKPFIITREMLIKNGDTIAVANLNNILTASKNLVFNTALFITVNVVANATEKNHINVIVEVKERWYFFPLPYFKLVDRNFNQWWVEQKRDLNRVNYGLKFIQQNLTGRNDELNFWLITGYSNQLLLRYNVPFIDKKLKHGFNMGIAYASQKEINIGTNNNKQVFFRDTLNFIRTLFRADFTYNYRPDQFWRFAVRASYINDKIADTVVKINPNFFPTGQTVMQYPDVSISGRYLNVDYAPYPTKGLVADAYIYTRITNAANSNTMVGIKGMYFKPVWKNAFMSFYGSANIRFPQTPIFVNNRLFGFGDFQMRGYEPNIMDGQIGIISKNTIHQQIAKFNIKTGLKAKGYDKIPFRIFFKMYSDFGYAHNKYPGNSILNNKFLYSGGVGLDILSFYDFVFRIEYSFNQLGNNGLFLNTMNDY
jgi:outer membrane protein assembly factor BamA